MEATLEATLEAARAAGWAPEKIARLEAALESVQDAPGAPEGGDTPAPAPEAPGPALDAPEAAPAPLADLGALYAAGQSRAVDLAPFGFQVQVQVRPLSWAELAELGIAFQALAREAGAFLSPSKSPEAAEAAEAAEAEAAEDALSRIAGMDPATVRRGGDLQGSICCASVTAASRDGGTTWTPIRLVQRQEDQDAARNRLWWGTLPPGAVGLIASTATARIQEGGRTARTFRG
jgi:hypothetical protein